MDININLLLLMLQMQQSKAAWQIGSLDTQSSQSSTDSLLFAIMLQSLLKDFGSGTSENNEQSTANTASKTNSSNAFNGNYKELIYSMGKKYGVDPQLLWEVIEAESNFNPNAVSPAGAQGLMQLMPGTAAAYGVTNAFDPVQNVEGGTRFLKDLLDRYNGNVELALAAYNAGPGAVEKYNGIPPYKETQNYVKKIMGELKGLDFKV